MQLAVPSLMPPSRRSRDVLESRVRAVLAAGPKANPYLQMAFQPVVDLRTGCIAGAEALARFKSAEGEPYRTPDLWFDDARRCGLSTQLELLAIESALARLDEMPPGTYLAVNASPETLVSDELRELLRRVAGERVVVELTEHARVDDYDALVTATAWFRARGIRLAVDDAGAGFASFQHILRLQPDIIKLDRSLTNGVDSNPVRFALASAMVTFAVSLGARICAEGIETAAEMAALQQLGIANGQGYFLGKPGPLPLPEPPPGVRLGALPSVAPLSGSPAVHVGRQLRDRAALIDALLAVTATSIVVYDVEGRLERASATACARFGRSEEELRGQRSGDLVHPDDAIRITNARAELLAGRAGRIELPALRYISRDGHDGHASCAASGVLVRDSAGAARFFVVTLS